MKLWVNPRALVQKYTLSVRKTFCIPSEFSVYCKCIQNFVRTLYIPLTNHAEACKCKKRLKTVKPIDRFSIGHVFPVQFFERKGK